MNRPPNKLFIDSLSALADYLKHKPKAIKQVYCASRQQEKVKTLLAGTGIPVFAPETLPEKDRPAGSFFAEVQIEPVDEASLFRQIAPRSKDTILALDHITDPRNLGAIARSAAYFGVREIIAPRDRQVLLTRASVATSQGAFALSDLVLVTNLGRTLAKLKDEGYWIIGTGTSGETLEAVSGVYDKVVLVLGSEDRGIAAGIAKKCDRLVTIEGAENRLDSLNVSVAAGIILRSFFLHFRA